MKAASARLLAGLALCACAAAAPADAQQVRLGSSDADARIVSRTSPAEAAHAIVTRDGRAALLLRPEGVALQLTDLGLREITDRKSERSDPDAGFLARMVAGIVRSSVQGLLDNAVEVPLEALAEARFEKGLLYFVDAKGERVFDDVQVNGRRVMEDFSPADARGFIRRFDAMKRGSQPGS